MKKKYPNYVLALLFLFISTETILSQTLNTDFSPKFEILGTVYAIKKQDDGKILIAGLFNFVNGIRKNGVARLNPDGTTDESFDVGEGPNNIVRDISIQDDGKILLVGQFTTFNGIEATRIVRLNSDGSIDSSFDGGTGFNSSVFRIHPLSNGKMYSAGRFSSYNDTPVSFIVRLNSNGTIDDTFQITTGATGGVNDMDIQSDGKIILVGVINNFQGINSKITRLDANGILDTSFNPSAGTNYQNYLYKITILPDDRMVVLGLSSPSTFLLLSPDGEETYYPWEMSFLTESIDSDNNGNVYIGTNRITHFNANTLEIVELTQSYNERNYLFALEITDDGKIWVGGVIGNFDELDQGSIINVNPDGEIDPDTQAETTRNGNVYSTYVLPNGKILVGGYFVKVNGEPHINLVQLNSDGSIDDSFVMTEPLYPGEFIYKVIVRKDGKILAGGSYLLDPNGNTPGLKLFNEDGSQDTDFNFEGGYGTIHKIVELPDNRIFINYFNLLGVVGGPAGKDYAILFENGETDLDFYQNQLVEKIYNIVVTDDDKLLVAAWNYFKAGEFRQLLKLNSDFTLDNSFQSINSVLRANGLTGFVFEVNEEPNGNILVGGRFSEIDGIPVASSLTRLTPDGQVDSTFNLGGDGFRRTSGIEGGIGKIINLGQNFIGTVGVFEQFNESEVNDHIILNRESGTTATCNFDVGEIDVNPFIGGLLDYQYFGGSQVLVGGDFSFGVNPNHTSLGLFDLNCESVNIEEINESPIKKVKLIPNPTSDRLNIFVDFEEPNQNVKILLFDLIGQLHLVKEERLSGQSLNSNINLSSFPKGTYFLKIETEEKFVVEKIIKQ